MVNGNSVVVEFGKESVFSTPVAPTNKVEVSSESLSYTANKTDEGLLTGRLGPGLTETMSKTVSGDIATLAKPKSVGNYLLGVFGKEAVTTSAEVTGKSIHTFTPIGNKETDFLPSFTFVIDRGVAAFKYTGVTFDSCEFSASAEDRLQLTVTTVGHDEITSDVSVDSALSSVDGTDRSFKFHQGKVYMDAKEVADVTSMTFNYANNCDSSTQTTSTGLYFAQPQPGQRTCTLAFDALYSTATEAVRKNQFKEDAIVAIKLEFKDSSNNTLTFNIPNAQISEFANPTATGADTLSASITVNAIDVSSDPFVNVVLVNDKTDQY